MTTPEDIDAVVARLTRTPADQMPRLMTEAMKCSRWVMNEERDDLGSFLAEHGWTRETLTAAMSDEKEKKKAYQHRWN